MDALRGIAVLLVIIQHSVTVPAYDGFPSSSELGQINDALAPYRIPLLLALSGMLLHRSLAKGLWTYSEGKLRRIAWPMLLWGPVTVLLTPSLSTVIGAFLGPRHLWFLVVLLFCYAIGVLALRINAIWLCIALIGMYSIPVVESQSWSNYLWFSAYFMFGAWLGPRLQRWQEAPGWVSAILGIVAALWSGLSLAGVALIAPAEFVVSLAGIATLIWVGSRLPRMRLAEWVGQRSIVFYVAHVPAMLVILWFMDTETTLSPLLISAIMIVVGAVGPLLLTPKFFTWLFVFPKMSRRKGESAASPQGSGPEKFGLKHKLPE